MNEVLQLLTDHRSIRSYTDEPVSDEQLDLIIQAAQAAPTSINGQQFTVIAVKDKERKKKYPNWLAASRGLTKRRFSFYSALILTAPKLRLKNIMIHRLRSRTV